MVTPVFVGGDIESIECFLENHRVGHIVSSLLNSCKDEALWLCL